MNAAKGTKQGASSMTGKHAFDYKTVGHNAPQDLIDRLDKIHSGVDAFVMFEDGNIILHELQMPKSLRGKGLGSKFMGTLTDYADNNNLPILLAAKGDFGGDFDGQHRFYRRHGFVDNPDSSAYENLIRKPEIKGFDFSETSDGLQNREDERDANQGYIAWKKQKGDVSRWDRIFSLPMYYFKKIPQLWAAYQAAQEYLGDKHNYQRDLLYDRHDRSFNKMLEDFKKAHPDEYKKVNKYLIQRDDDRLGYRIERSKDQATIGKWVVTAGKDTELPAVEGVFNTRDQASAAAWESEARNYEANGGSKEGAEAVKNFRTIGSNMLRMISKTVQDMIDKAEEAGLPEPQIVTTDENGNPVKISLKVAIAKMGDLEGSYFPRRRESGAYVLKATKDGENTIRKHFDLAIKFKDEKDWRSKLPLPINLEARQWREKGYNVTLEKAEHMPESVFIDAAGQQVALETLLNQAIKGFSQDTKRTLGDIGIQSRWSTGKDGKRTFTIYGEGVDAKHHPDILKKLGGEYHYVSSAKAGYPSIIFHDAKEGIEKTIKEYLFDYRLMKASTDANIALGITNELADIFKGRGGLVGRIKRSEATGKDVVKGYEEDAIRAFTSAAMGLAGSTAKGEMARKLINIQTGRTRTWEEFKMASNDLNPDYKQYLDECKKASIDPTVSPEAYKDLNTYTKDMLRNPEQLDRIMGAFHGLATLKYLAFKVSSAAINMTSLATSVPATMTGTAKIPLHKVPGLLMGAGRAYYEYKFGDINKLDPWTQKAMKYIETEGWDEQQFNHEAMASLQGKAAGKFKKFMEYGMLAFGVTEQINRVSTIMAAYQGIKDQYKGEWTGTRQMAALQLAKEVSDLSHGDYSKGNQSALTRGGSVAANVMKMALVFKMYAHNYLLNMKKLGFEEKNYKAFAYLAISPMILSGLGAGALTPVIAAILKGMGVGGDDPEEEFYKWVESEMGSTPAAFARTGAFGMGGKGASFTGSMNFGLMEYPKNIAELFGAPGGVAMDLIEGFKEFSQGDVMKGAEKVLPTAFGAPIKAYRQATEGFTTKKDTPIFYGKDQLRFDMIEAAMSALSFNPARTAMIREKQWGEKKKAAIMQDELNGIYSSAKRMFMKPYDERSESEAADIIAKMTRYNNEIAADKNLALTPLTWKRIMTGVNRSMQPTKRERSRAVGEE
jgi:hypothetical protein